MYCGNSTHVADDMKSADEMAKFHVDGPMEQRECCKDLVCNLNWRCAGNPWGSTGLPCHVCVKKGLADRICLEHFSKLNADRSADIISEVTFHHIFAEKGQPTVLEGSIMPYLRAKGFAYFFTPIS